MTVRHSRHHGRARVRGFCEGDVQPNGPGAASLESVVVYHPLPLLVVLAMVVVIVVVAVVVVVVVPVVFVVVVVVVVGVVFSDHLMIYGHNRYI